jgi:signal transduction histidine kinase
LQGLKNIIKENVDIRIILVAVCYFLSAYLGIILAFHDSYTSPVWPPVGIGFALLILLGVQSWPGITIGSLVSYMLVFWLKKISFGSGSILAATIISAGNTLEILVGYYLVKRLISVNDPFQKTYHTFIFLVISLIMCLIGSIVGTFSFYFNDLISQDELIQKGFFWWIPNVASVLLFTPFILSWSRSFSTKFTRNHLIEIIIFIVLLASFGILLHIDKLSATVEKSTPFLVIPFLLWLAFRFNLQISMAGILFTALSAVYFTTINVGPFVLESNENSIIILQIFIGVISTSIIVLSSTVYERNGAEQTIIKFNETLETRIKERTKELNDEINYRKKTEQKLKITNRRLRKANIELDNFVYRVSHDLRAPVASVLGLANLAKNEKDLANIKGYFEMVNKSAEQQDIFIRDILNISRNSRLGLERKKISFKKLIDETLSQLKYSDKDKQIDTRLNINENLPFYSDPGRIKVIFNNIFSNSIRYTNGNNTLININIEVGKAFAGISISDNGIGIERKHHKKIFDMFYRATDKNAGSGLGLYIVKESIEKLNGEVTLESEPGKGTTLNLRIPNMLNGNEETDSSSESVPE